MPFVQKLYAAINGDQTDSNCFISPLSIYSGLSLALCGSANASYDELLSVLNFHSEDSNDVEGTLALLGKSLGDVLDSENDKTLVLANGLFLDVNFEADTNFKKILQNNFEADSHQVDFGTASEDARRHINEWISEQTSGKIADLMPRGSIDSQTRLVLANAIYFKGTWEHVFDRAMTSNGLFHTLSGETVNVPMMMTNGSYLSAHFEEIKATAIKIPFKVHNMLIVLPDERNGLPELLRTLSKSKDYFSGLFEGGRYHRCQFDITMPKFKLGCGANDRIDLKKPLTSMGLQGVFEESRADFSRITNKERLFISEIFHQAVIEVDEEGAEAAAATGISIMPVCIPPKFIVDHPFLFLIITFSGVPAFMGHVINPLDNQ
ncbi:unnamed protein product [Hymenolepis diminuta]|uniref:Serpin domain-containing protein n=1 Tax=Hymenolepis diminuta TaxID=6216 RepID=A0A3P6ZQ26_HYMDI|nr:unnamed protein product [Hymenolepis diminuta]